VGDCVLGDLAYPRKCLQRAGTNPEEQSHARRLVRSDRVSWGERVKQAEALLGRRWPEMIGAHGDWGRDGLHYVATRYGGYRLTELLTKIDGVKRLAAAPGGAALPSAVGGGPGSTVVRGSVAPLAGRSIAWVARGSEAEHRCLWRPHAEPTIVKHTDLTPLPIRDKAPAVNTSASYRKALRDARASLPG
jgi:hypothetical protein